MNEKICDTDSLTELFCREFTLKTATAEKEAFLIYFNQQCYAYENSCPHTGVNLNWKDEQFFSVDGLFLQCCVHGALFEPDTGRCVRGPCLGQSLKPVKIMNKNGSIFSVG